MHRRHIDDPQVTFRGRPLGRYLTPIMNHHDDIRSRLGEIGLRPSDVEILVSTHFHFDHAGNHADFGHARIIVQRECYGYAKANPVACPPDPWDLPDLTYDLIDGDRELTAGVSWVETSGHVPGHMSVVVRLPRTGTVVLAIDAIYLHENLERDLWRGQVDPDRGVAAPTGSPRSRGGRMEC
jgi:N-acyl homoserine lactone hydrolase